MNWDQYSEEEEEDLQNKLELKSIYILLTVHNVFLNYIILIIFNFF